MKKLLLSCLAVLFATSIFAEIPVGYYHKADGLQKEALKSALNDIVSYGKFLSYGGGTGFTWEGFYYTDRNAADSSVIDMYSNEVFKFTYTDGKPDFQAVEGMHIEHALPKSWWGGIQYNAYKDLNHLFPAEGRINSAKNDLPLGIVGEATSDNGVSKVGKNTFRTEDYSGNCFEPNDEYKGDFARAYFYVVTAYEEFSEIWESPMIDKNTYPVWKDWALDLLLQWHRNDPVSPKELTRQEAVYGVQGNRNPFIDYPELVEHIWGTKTAETFDLPTETRAYLVSPTRWDKCNFGVVMTGNKPTHTFTFEGYNINSDILLKIKNETQEFALSKARISATESNQKVDVTLTFNAGELGDFADTLVINGGGLSTDIQIPLHATVTSDFMALDPTEVGATTATLNWMNIADATSYAIDVYESCDRAGDLFFSYYIEGSSNNKAVAIYNGTGKTVDLSKYALKKQSNGLGSFKGIDKLSGTLKNGETYVLAYYQADDEIKSLADKLIGKYESTEPEDLVLSFNGNDALALYHSGIMIDVIGEIDNVNNWSIDETLVRKSSVTGPTTAFNWNEWERQPKDYITGLDTHKATFGAKKMLLQNHNVGNTTSYTIRKLTPDHNYAYSITAIGAQNKVSENIMQWRTKGLDAPLALDAEAIFSDEFEPTWETSPEASQKYLIDVFSLDGPGITHEFEGFDNLSSNGTPLPTSWSGTISGNYTTAASSGTATPAAAFKNEGEYLQTPTYASPITSLSFVAKYNSGGEGSNLVIEALSDGIFTQIGAFEFENNSKKTLNYTFDKEKNYCAIRFTYHKAKGNLALDDVEITYGYQDTTMLLENEDWYAGWYVRSSLLAEGDTILPETNYYYRLRATVGDYVSDYSNLIKVTTLAEGNENPDPKPNIVPDPEPETPVDIISADESLLIWSNRNGIGFSGIETTTRIAIFDIGGRLLYTHTTNAENHFVPFGQHGIFIVQATDNQQTRSYKIVK